MNLFRLAGDLSHLLAIFILLIKIWRTRSCAGTSWACQLFHVDMISLFQEYLERAKYCLLLYSQHDILISLQHSYLHTILL